MKGLATGEDQRLLLSDSLREWQWTCEKREGEEDFSLSRSGLSSDAALINSQSQKEPLSNSAAGSDDLSSKDPTLRQTQRNNRRCCAITENPPDYKTHASVADLKFPPIQVLVSGDEAAVVFKVRIKK